MKKIILLFSLVFLFIPGIAGAEDADLLAGKVMFGGRGYNSPYQGVTTNKLTDGDWSTNAPGLSTPSGNISAPYGFYYKFDHDVNVSSATVSANNYAEVRFYNAAGVIIGSLSYSPPGVSASTGQNKQLTAPITGVRGVYLYNGTSQQVVTLYEFKVFGSDSVTVNPEPEKFVVNGLKYTPTSVASGTLSWDGINSNYLKYYKVYQGTDLLGTTTTNSLSISQLVPGNTYDFKVAALDKFDVEYTASTVSHSVPVPDTTPPAVPTNVQVAPDRYRATVTANPVLDDDLAGFHVYLNGNRVTSQPVQLPYDLTGLRLETDYELEIASIDTSGNLSARSQKVSFKTLGLESEPTAVTVTGSPYNGGASLSWSPVSAAKEYKVYKADGTFIMKTTQTSVKIPRLKNGQVYEFYVVASNDIGDSPRSNVVEVKPSSTLAPDVTLGYSLKDVTDGTSSWFSSFWLLLAFTISIPLSFYVSNRVKGLFES